MKRLGLGLLLAATACGGSSAGPLAAPTPSTPASPVAQDLSGGGYGGPLVTSAASPSATRRSPTPSPAMRMAVQPASKPAPKRSPEASPTPLAQPSPAPSPRPSPQPSPTAARAATTYGITMQGMRFSPASLTIAVGDSVRVRNGDTAHHTFTDSPVFDSGDLAPGATFTYRFTQAGRYDFVCTYHASAGMTGTITVR